MISSDGLESAGREQRGRKEGLPRGVASLPLANATKPADHPQHLLFSHDYPQSQAAVSIVGRSGIAGLDSWQPSGELSELLWGPNTLKKTGCVPQDYMNVLY